MRGDVVAGVEDDEDVAVTRVPAARSRSDRSTTRRAWAAVTSATSSSGPRQTASRSCAPRGPARLQGGDERVRPAGNELIRGPSAAAVDVTEQTLRAGRRVGAEPVAHVDREDEAPVDGLRHAAGPPEPAAAAATSTFPLFSASYIAPCPRRCSAVSVRSTGEVTGPSAHSNASTSSNSSSPRVVRQSKRSSRKREAFANASAGTASGSRLTLTAFELVKCLFGQST